MTKFAMPCVILCGGRSTRMGQLKQDLIFNAQESLANFQARRLQQWFLDLYFSAKFAIPNAFGIETIVDSAFCARGVGEARLLENLPKEQFAPIFGLQSVLEALQCDVFVLSIDTPFFDRHCVELLWQAYSKNPKPTFARNSKTHPLLGIYPLQSLVEIETQIAKGDYKLMRLLENINAQFVQIDESKTLNLNTPEDYQKACQQIES